MADLLRLEPFEFYWNDASGPPTSFDAWLQDFCNWLRLKDIGRATSLTDCNKNSLLRHYLGKEGRRIFASNAIAGEEENTSFARYKEAVKKQFAVKANPVRAVYDLLSRKQGSTEPVAEYVSTLLRLLAAETEFCGNCEDVYVAAALVLGTCSHEARKAMFKQPTTRDLNALVDLVRTEESAASNVKAVEQNTAASVNAMYH